jgi:tripartite-type tricarboxylate transporter receptor subunit TctC
MVMTPGSRMVTVLKAAAKVHQVPKRNRRQFITAVAAGSACCAFPALGQGMWPTRPVRIVHGFGPGGPVDIFARLVAAQFPEHFGQQAIVEGKPGAGGTLGANFVAKSEPDGYTLFFMASGHSAAPGLYKSLPYDPLNDFTMISMVARSPFAIVAGPSFKGSSVQDLVAQAKADPGKIDYGSGGNGSGMHLAAVLFQARGDVRFTHVPYKGGSAMVLALMGGEVPVAFTSLAGMSSHFAAGKIKPLAVTSASRFPGVPAVPTVAETVLPGFDVSAWYALAAPKNLRPEIVTRLNTAMQATLRNPNVVQTLRQEAADPWPTSSEEAKAFLAADVARWTKVVRDENISVTN